MADNLTFANIIRRERHIRALTREELAERIGCDARTITRWETGRGFPRPYYLQRIMDICEIDAVELGIIQTKMAEILPPDTEDHPLAAQISQLEQAVAQIQATQTRTDPELALQKLTQMSHRTGEVNWTFAIIATVWLLAFNIPLAFMLRLAFTHDLTTPWSVIPWSVVAIIQVLIQTIPIQLIKRMVNAHYPPKEPRKSPVVAQIQLHAEKKYPTLSKQDLSYRRPDFRPRYQVSLMDIENGERQVTNI